MLASYISRITLYECLQNDFISVDFDPWETGDNVLANKRLKNDYSEYEEYDENVNNIILLPS